MKRYFMECYYNRVAGQDQAQPVVDKEGEWVRYKDAKAEIDRLTQERDEIKAQVTKETIPEGYVVVPVKDVIEILAYREDTTIYEEAEGRLRRAFDEAAKENNDGEV